MNHFPVADFFFEEIRDGSHTTRIERQGDNLFAVLNDVIFHPKETTAEHRRCGCTAARSWW